MSDKDDMGTRLKRYEALETERRFMPLLPVYARIDGRCFSNFTKRMRRPYDIDFSQAMIETTKSLVKHTHAKIGYTQSDEISLVWMQEIIDSEIFFTGKIQKMVSVLAAMASATFNQLCMANDYLRPLAKEMTPHFDCRVFQLPNIFEATNVFLWREMDATKNAISMAARSFYPHKALIGKNGSDMQEMIFQKGQNFNDYPSFFKRGTFVRKHTTKRPYTEEEIERIPAKHRPAADSMIYRTDIVELEMPKFVSILNREAVIFEGETPRLIVGIHA